MTFVILGYLCGIAQMTKTTYIALFACFAFLLLSGATEVQAQTTGTFSVKKPEAEQTELPRQKWKRVEVRIFKDKTYPDDMQLVGEWMVKVRKPDKVDLLDDVSWGELRKMKKKTARAGGLVVFVDVKNYYGKNGKEIYCLGMIKRKK